jgi:hypothetical protein
LEPEERFLAALTDAGWKILSAQPLIGTGNPMVIQIIRAKVRHGLLLYTWRVTNEGKGRKKAGRQDTDFRVQTTRSHEGPLRAEPGHVTLGLGWDEERGVFAAFDPWIKRFTGTSSSVHFHRSLLDEGARTQWVEEMREDGPETAFTPAMVDRYLGWAFGDAERPLFRFRPEEFTRTGESATLVVKTALDSLKARPGDSCLVLASDGRVADKSVWRIGFIQDIERVTVSGNYHRVALQFSCTRLGVILNEPGIEGLGK